MVNIEFRNIRDDESEKAYRIICDVTEWLRLKGIRQWTEPLPRAVFDFRQARGENFGLFVDGTLTVFMSLIPESVPYWKEEIGTESRWWLCTLATKPEQKGNRLGEEAVRQACRFLKGRDVKELYLDCVREGGFLPGYYSRLGFMTVAEKVIDFPKCGRTDMVLMKRPI